MLCKFVRSFIFDLFDFLFVHLFFISFFSSLISSLFNLIILCVCFLVSIFYWFVHSFFSCVFVLFLYLFYSFICLVLCFFLLINFSVCVFILCFINLCFLCCFTFSSICSFLLSVTLRVTVSNLVVHCYFDLVFLLIINEFILSELMFWYSLCFSWTFTGGLCFLFALVTCCHALPFR